MAQYRKFEFQTDFAMPEPPPVTEAPEEEADPPVYTDDELRGARDHGYEAGLAAGRAQALGDAEIRLCELLEGVQGRLQGMADGVAERHSLVAQDIVLLARAIAAKVTGARATEENLRLVEEMAQECLTSLYQAPEVTIRVDPALAEELRERLLATALSLSVTVTGDEHLQGADCRIDWQDGGATRLDADILQDIDELLARYAPTSGAKADPPQDSHENITRPETGGENG